MYTSKDICDYFAITRETVRLWSVTFADYLSPGATPAKGQQRNYNDDDLAVFALVSEMRAAGDNTDNILATLASGQRGDVPTGPARKLAGPVELRSELARVENRLQVVQADLLRAEGKIELLEAQNQALQDEIRDLYRELARFEAREDDDT